MDSIFRYLCHPQDDDFANLQLAAELGKTLLERNQELEDTVRQQQVLIEEQAQELQPVHAEAEVSDASRHLLVSGSLGQSRMDIDDPWGPHPQTWTRTGGKRRHLSCELRSHLCRGEETGRR
ncbi:hypothetical protein ISCGN_022018 [Ixodes scapularis]